MTGYLLKTNATACPNGSARPSVASDWEVGLFSAPKIASKPSTSSDGKAGPVPDAGSRIFIWVNEDSGGRGLTASATIDRVEDHGKQYCFGLKDIRLLTQPFGMGIAYSLRPGSVLIREMKAYRPQRIWALSDLEIASLDDLVDLRDGFLVEKSVDNGWSAAVASEAANIDLASETSKRELRWGRPDQQAFRDAAILRHDGKCVFTGCGVKEAIHAAHVVPHTGHPQFERPDNSLILRMDIHGLFDADLISIDPATSVAVVSAKLAKTSYIKLAGKPVDHKLSPVSLQHHFDRFRAAQREQSTTT